MMNADGGETSAGASSQGANGRDESATDEDIVRVGMKVILQTATNQHFVEMRDGVSQRLGKSTVRLRDLLGQPLGSIFEMDRGQLKKVTGELLANYDDEAGADVDNGALSPDNRGFADTCTAQMLDHSEIEEMKMTASSNKEIIEALKANSQTYAGKTTFSKAKWLKKKQLKYLPRVRVLRATAPAISQVYFDKHPHRMGGLRVDSLALALSYANVRADAQLLIWDELMGVVTGAAADRMGLRGRILALHAEEQLSQDALKRYNFAPAELSSFLVPVPTSWVSDAVALRVRRGEGDTDGPPALEPAAAADTIAASPATAQALQAAQIDADEDAEEQEEDGKADASDSLAPAAANGGVNCAAAASLKPKLKGQLGCGTMALAAGRTVDEVLETYRTVLIARGRKGAQLQASVDRRRQKLLKALERPKRSDVLGWLADGSDGLILATKHDPTAALQGLLPLVKPGGTFVVFSEFLEPLLACFQSAKAHLPAVRLQMFDTWYREYQTLPGRMHPSMNMSPTGGYLLCGMRVLGEGEGAGKAAKNVSSGDLEAMGGGSSTTTSPSSASTPREASRKRSRAIADANMEIVDEMGSSDGLDATGGRSGELNGALAEPLEGGEQSEV